MKAILRIIKHETFSAYILIPVALLALAIGSHWSTIGLEQMRSIAGWHFTIREFTLDYLLGIFFYSVGLQLRTELAQGSLQNKRVLVVSATAALSGMALPALLFVVANHLHGNPSTGWGITMATDLPFVLAMLVVLQRHHLKGFVLALATIDDIASVVVLSIVYHVKVHLVPLLFLIVLVSLYYLVSRYISSRLILCLLLALSLALAHRAGVQTSIVAALLGVITSRHRESERGLQENLLSLVEPISAYLVIPVFVFITLLRRYDFSWHSVTSTLVVFLVVTRLVGKPLGIFIGGWVSTRATGLALPFHRSELALIGVLGTLGLDVSLIFAQKSFAGGAENLAILGILLTIPLAVVFSVLAHVLSPRHKSM